MKCQQLFKIIPEMTLSHYFDSGRGEIIQREADNTPFLRWPNGIPCLMANAYMVHLLKRNLSRRNKGGTLRQYAKDISPLIRYCYTEGIDFSQLNNGHFTSLIKSLREERDPISPEARKRDSNTLISIGRKSLDFLDFVGQLNGHDNYVIGTIQAKKVKYSIRAKNAKNGSIEKHGWYHDSFDTPSPKKSRSPISKTTIQALHEAIPSLSSAGLSKESKRFIDRRRTIMLRLLEMTGARIEEIAQLRVKDVELAFNQKDPKLRLITLKKRRQEDRFVPVLHQDLSVLKAYIRVSRAKVIKETIGSTKDHDFMFVSERNGKALSSRYMSNEIGLLRRTAGITSQACAHMFRNRFITKLFVRLINQFDFETKDEFRKALIDAKALKQEVQQYTGHGSIDSLDTYIDLAFDEVSNLKAVVNIVHLQSAYDSFDSNVELLHRELASGLPASVYIRKYNELIELRIADINRLNKLEQNHED